MSIEESSTTMLPIGSIIASKYRIERLVGQGGMGVVFAAQHIDLCENYALKLMRTAELGNPQAVERFLREARAAVKLKTKSQHVVQVHDVGRLESGEPYIVMELLHGEDLAEMLKRRGPLPIEEACSYVMQACDALIAAHALGIIHRDLKPGNLFLARQEGGRSVIKVLDFGISKHTMASGRGDAEMTSTQDIMGSPAYMSPEQMRSARSVDAKADIWSLGAILYKLLTNRLPFIGGTTPEIYAAVLESKPARPPSVLRNEIPKQLDAIVLRCLEKNPARRYGRVNDLLSALSLFLRSMTAEPDPEGEEAQTLLRPLALPVALPPKALVDLTGTVPMSPEDLRAAARIGLNRSPAAPHNRVETSPKRELESPPQGNSSGPEKANGPNETIPLGIGMVASAAVDSPGPLPQAPRPAQRRPTLSGVGEPPLGLMMQPPPIPASPPSSPMSRRPSFTGNVQSPLAEPMRAALSSGAWPMPAPEPRPSIPSQPMPAAPPAMPSQPLMLTGSSLLPPPGESTGMTTAPWTGPAPRIPALTATANRRRLLLIAGGLSACVVIALLAGLTNSQGQDERSPAQTNEESVQPLPSIAVTPFSSASSTSGNTEAGSAPSASAMVAASPSAFFAPPQPSASAGIKAQTSRPAQTSAKPQDNALSGEIRPSPKKRRDEADALFPKTSKTGR